MGNCATSELLTPCNVHAFLGASHPTTKELPVGQPGKGNKDESAREVPRRIPEGSCHQAPCNANAIFRGLD